SGQPCTATASMCARTPCASMRRINSGSIGEIPPSTRGRPGRSAAAACAARIVISEKMRQSGSRSTKSQCDLLLGSFQNITASITLCAHFRGPAMLWPVAGGAKNIPSVAVDIRTGRSPQRALRVSTGEDGNRDSERALIAREQGSRPVCQVACECLQALPALLLARERGTPGSVEQRKSRCGIPQARVRKMRELGEPGGRECELQGGRPEHAPIPLLTESRRTAGLCGYAPPWRSGTTRERGAIE